MDKNLNKYTIIISLLTILLLVEISNQFQMSRIENKINILDKKATEFFEPILPEWEDNQHENKH
jgi:hypothetical protein